MPDTKDSRVLIIVALIGLTGTITAALIANFDKLFRRKQADQQVASATMSPAPGAPPSTSSQSSSQISGATPSQTSTPSEVPKPSPTEYQKQTEETPTPTPIPGRRPVFTVNKSTLNKSRSGGTIPGVGSLLTGEEQSSDQALPKATDPEELDANHRSPIEGDRDTWRHQLSSYKAWYDLRISNPKAAYDAGQRYLRFARSDDGKEDVRRYIRAYEQTLKQQ